MMEPRIQYAKTEDGVSIAYATVGNGPALVVLPAVWEQFSLFRAKPLWQRFYEQLGQGRRLVHYDRRGFGLSQRELDDELWVADAGQIDLEAVFRALQLDSAMLFASTFAGPTAISYAVRHPDDVSHLILYGTFSRASDVIPQEQADALVNLARTNWHTAAQLFADMSAREPHPEESLELAAIFRESADGENVARLVESGAEVDMDDLLHRVRCKTLVIHRRDDGFMPFRTGQKLAAGIPNAQLVPLEGSVHGYQLDESGAILAAIEGFLTGREPSPAKPHVAPDMYTILFTDMESSTALTQSLGDSGAQEVRRAHNEIVRAALSANGGSEIKHTGDGIMASFSTASSALECAIAIQRGVAAHKEEQPDSPLGVYVGLNAGEPIAEDDPDGRVDLFGTSVDLAARICDHAAPSQILASNVVRELAAGKQFLFSDLGETELRGFEDPVKLWELRWQEASN